MSASSDSSSGHKCTKCGSGGNSENFNDKWKRSFNRGACVAVVTAAVVAVLAHKFLSSPACDCPQSTAEELVQLMLDLPSLNRKVNQLASDIEDQAERWKIVKSGFENDTRAIMDGIKQMNVSFRKELIDIETDIQRLEYETEQELITIKTTLRRLDNVTGKANLDLFVRRIVNTSVELERAEIRELKRQLATLQLLVKPLHEQFIGWGEDRTRPHDFWSDRGSGWSLVPVIVTLLLAVLGARRR